MAGWYLGLDLKNPLTRLFSNFCDVSVSILGVEIHNHYHLTHWSMQHCRNCSFIRDVYLILAFGTQSPVVLSNSATWLNRSKNWFALPFTRKANTA